SLRSWTQFLVSLRKLVLVFGQVGMPTVRLSNAVPHAHCTSSPTIGPLGCCRFHGHLVKVEDETGSSPISQQKVLKVDAGLTVAWSWPCSRSNFHRLGK